MPKAKTEQTTIMLPYAPYDQLQWLAWQYIEANLLRPGEQLEHVVVDSASGSAESGEMQALVTYLYWPADNSGLAEK
ncbi:hypothetical protein [Mycolicibacterium sp. HK-90]|uniref:hypothetical protein n=1 Tax=Mycolicibacterium sp. HK-90 TaxID=3056937 RepID=UPI002659E723|nr:hypothetical protein [Mycolicibacterium sp. HK-90]WKG06018.1 hypothetical protein QU592_13465 [Mycolicibacterium sp. HK-90]